MLASCTTFAFAAEQSKLGASSQFTNYSYDELIAIACNAFPEHADKIHSPCSAPSNYTLSSSDAELIETKSVALSDTETVTYYEYANTMVFITYTDEFIRQTSSTNGNLTTVTGIVSVICNMSSDVFYISGFSYCINSAGYDSIVSAGQDLSSCDSSVYWQRDTETASQSACHRYIAVFESPDGLEYNGATGYQAIIDLNVRNNVFSILINGS